VYTLLYICVRCSYAYVPLSLSRRGRTDGDGLRSGALLWARHEWTVACPASFSGRWIEKWRFGWTWTVALLQGSAQYTCYSIFATVLPTVSATATAYSVLLQCLILSIRFWSNDQDSKAHYCLSVPCLWRGTGSQSHSSIVFAPMVDYHVSTGNYIMRLPILLNWLPICCCPFHRPLLLLSAHTLPEASQKGTCGGCLKAWACQQTSCFNDLCLASNFMIWLGSPKGSAWTFFYTKLLL
jgi:hypothetical protein